MSHGGFVSNFEVEKSWNCFLHSPRSHVGDVLWNSEQDSRRQFSHCFWSPSLVFRKMSSQENEFCPSHRCQMRRGTPLTRYWFMPALNTQRFATVLTHQLTCFSHAEYNFCVTVYQSDVQSEFQSVCKENLKFTGFTLLSQTHTSIDMRSNTY